MNLPPEDDGDIRQDNLDNNVKSENRKQGDLNKNLVQKLSQSSTSEILVSLLEKKQIRAKRNSEKNDNRIARDQSKLYEVLDYRKQGRKRMFQLLSNPPSPKSELWIKFRESTLYNDCSMEIEKWYDHEAGSNSNAHVGIGNVPKINFAWSSLSSSMRTLKDSAPSTTNEQTHRMNSQTQSSMVTNEYLLNRAKNKARTLREKQMINEKLTTNQQSPQRTATAPTTSNSTFKMDPLELFVAQALPREKKKIKRHKRKSILWFWGSNEKKTDHKEIEQLQSKSGHFRRTTVSSVSDENTESHHNNYTLDVVSIPNNSPLISIPSSHLEQHQPNSLIDDNMSASQLQPQSSPSKLTSLSAFEPLTPNKK